MVVEKILGQKCMENILNGKIYRKKLKLIKKNLSRKIRLKNLAGR